MGGDARGPGPEDRAAAPGLCRGRRTRLRPDGEARLSGPVTIDLRLAGLDGADATHLILGPEPALVDPGPSITLPVVRAGLAELGLEVRDLHWVLLTHVHLDHAGGAGHLTREHPGLRVLAHEDALPHLADPERLVASTRRTFGDRHDALWGEMLPVPEEQLVAWGPAGAGKTEGRAPEEAVGSAARGREGEGSGVPEWIRVIPTPGHLPHHISFLDERDGTLYAGDALGIRLAPGTPPHPATPPPGIDLDAWRGTLDRIRSLAPERAALQHFGVHDDPVEGASRLEAALDALERRVRGAMARGSLPAERAGFDEDARAIAATYVGRDAADRYFDIFRATHDWDGVFRWIEKGGPR